MEKDIEKSVTARYNKDIPQGSMAVGAAQ